MSVGDLGAAGGVGADVVALDDVVPGAAAVDDDAVLRVAGDDVARATAGAADRVGRRLVDRDAAVAVGDRAGAAGVGADIGAEQLIAAGGGGVELDAGLRVAGDDDAVAAAGAADGVAGRLEDDALLAVAGGDRAGEV